MSDKREEKGSPNENMAAANAFHDEVMNAARSAIQAARQAGDELRVTKVKVGHGKWTAYLQQNFKSTPETARGYMRIARFWDTHLRDVVENDPDLSLTVALRILRPEKEKSGPLHTLRLNDDTRDHLLQTFKKYLCEMEDEVVTAFSEHWDDIWLDVSVRLCEALNLSVEDIDDELKAAILKKGRRAAMND